MRLWTLAVLMVLSGCAGVEAFHTPPIAEDSPLAAEAAAASKSADGSAPELSTVPQRPTDMLSDKQLGVFLDELNAEKDKTKDDPWSALPPPADTDAFATDGRKKTGGQ